MKYGKDYIRVVWEISLSNSVTCFTHYLSNLSIICEIFNQSGSWVPSLVDFDTAMNSGSNLEYLIKHQTLDLML